MRNPKTRSKEKSHSTAIIAAVASILAALIAAGATYITTERKLSRQYELETKAEETARELLMDKEWRLRSFCVIKHQLAGLDDNELRRILIRMGAIRIDSKSGIEMWGLRERNPDRVGVMRIDDDPHQRPSPPEAKELVTAMTDCK